MARLTTKQRDRLPKRDYALPKKIHRGKRGAEITKGAYPIENKAHARVALARIARFGSPSEIHKVRAAVHRKFPSMHVSGLDGDGRRKKRRKS